MALLSPPTPSVAGSRCLREVGERRRTPRAAASPQPVGQASEARQTSTEPGSLAGGSATEVTAELAATRADLDRLRRSRDDLTPRQRPVATHPRRPGGAPTRPGAARAPTRPAVDGPSAHLDDASGTIGAASPYQRLGPWGWPNKHGRPTPNPLSRGSSARSPVSSAASLSSKARSGSVPAGLPSIPRSPAASSTRDENSSDSTTRSVATCSNTSRQSCGSRPRRARRDIARLRDRLDRLEHDRSIEPPGLSL